MVSKSGLKSMTTRGVEKISLWKESTVEGKQVWEECPNLPKPFLQTYLNRGFVQSPPELKVPEPEVVEEEKVETFSEAIASGKLDIDARINKKIGQSKKV